MPKLKPVSLRGTIEYHDELRQWIGLRLSKPVCGQDEIQLVFPRSQELLRAESLVGCVVSARGAIYESPTGYYSAQLAMNDIDLRPDSTCHPAPMKADPGTVPIPPAVQNFHVLITIDYRGKGHTDVKARRSDDQESLVPWQAFAAYDLTGSGDVVWLHCHAGFTISNIRMRPGGDIFTDDKLSGVTIRNTEGVNAIDFDCSRQQPAKHEKSPASIHSPALR